ncbi:unnamed protein product [Heterobilharzia americana]|nr:unnamed protein product [Heterobilharzia americana]
MRVIQPLDPIVTTIGSDFETFINPFHLGREEKVHKMFYFSVRKSFLLNRTTVQLLQTTPQYRYSRRVLWNNVSRSSKELLVNQKTPLFYQPVFQWGGITVCRNIDKTFIRSSICLMAFFHQPLCFEVSENTLESTFKYHTG